MICIVGTFGDFGSGNLPKPSVCRRGCPQVCSSGKHQPHICVWRVFKISRNVNKRQNNCNTLWNTWNKLPKLLIARGTSSRHFVLDEWLSEKLEPSEHEQPRVVKKLALGKPIEVHLTNASPTSGSNPANQSRMEICVFSNQSFFYLIFDDSNY